MLDDHKEFIEQVITKAAIHQNYKQTKQERKEYEEATIVSLMEVTGLKRLEVKKIMEKTRQEQYLKEQKNNYFSPLKILKVISIISTVSIIAYFLIT